MRAGLRLAAGVVAVVLGLAGVAACTGGDDDGWADDSVAAYVGDIEITEAELDEVADDLRAELGAEIENELDRLAADGDLSEAELAAHEERRFGELDNQVAVNRTRTLEMRILTEAARGYTEREGLAVPAPRVEQHAHDLGLAEDSRYARVVADFYAVLAVLQVDAGSVPPTEVDQREVYDNLVSKGLTTAPFDEAQEVLDQELMGQQVAIRNLLRGVVAEAEVRVRPDYDLVYRVPVPVGSGESWLAVPLGGAD